MATADEYAAWIVKNADKQGTPDFETVATAYRTLKGQTGAAAIPTEPGANLTPTQQAPLSFMDTVRGAIETPLAIGANLVTGPVTYLAGALGPKAQQAVSNEITYQPRTQLAQNNLEAVGRALEASKLPPFNPMIAGGNVLAQSIQPATRAVGDVIRPPVSNALQSVRNGALNLVAGAGGFTLDKPAETLKQAFTAGREGNKAFVGAMRGADAMDDTLSKVKNTISDIQTANSEAYKTAKTGWAADKTPLEFAPIDDAMTRAEKSLQEAGHSKIGSVEQAKIGEVRAVVDEWKADPAAHNAVGLDALKQRIDAIYPDNPRQNQAQRVITQVRNAVKDTITAQAPDYAAAMKDYEAQLGLVRDINKALGTGDKVAKETAINKLMSIIKDSPVGDYKRGLVERAGLSDLLPAVSGQALSGVWPTGMGKVSALGLGGTAFLMNHPELIAAAPLTSPRLMGEMFYGAGRLAGSGGKGVSQLRGSLRLSPEQLNALAPIMAINANQLAP